MNTICCLTEVPMPKACEVKKGNVVDINGDIYMVKHIEVKTPSARGAVTLYKVRFTHIKTKQKFESSYKGNDVLEDVVLSRKPVQYLYPDGELHVFMDTLEYAQHLIAEDTIEDDAHPAAIGCTYQSLESS